MENQKLVNEKLDQVVDLLKEISEIEGKKVAFVLMASSPAPEKGEHTNKLITAVYGYPVATLGTVREAMDKNENVAEVLNAAVKMSPLEATFLRAMAGGSHLEEEDETPCDCPECREEEEERRPYERGEDFEARRKEANKNNPNVN